MIDFIDRWLDRITMYRLLLYYLIVLLCAGLLFGALGYLPYSPITLTISTVYLLLVCWVANRVFAHVFDVPHNPESSLITALILALIITPISATQNFVFLSAAGGLAMASKYLLNIRGKHVFNPAAVAVALTALGAGDSASWWVGNAYLAPFVIVGGLLLVRKLRRFTMVGTFVIVASFTTALFTLLSHGSVGSSLQQTFLHSSLLFLAFVMLTEPLTAPATRPMQAWYAAIVGVLFAPQIHIGGLYSTPELALVVGNVFAYIVSPKAKPFLRLVERIPMGPSSFDFVFQPNRRFAFVPGQYMEFTLTHPNPDVRGVRRYFTLASSPTEDLVHVGVRFYDKGSTYKRSMLNLRTDQSMLAGALGGDFTLPADPSQPVVLIAGGIGITPYRSMLKYLVDSGEQRPVTLLYSERTEQDIAYRDVLQAAVRHGIRVVCTLTDQQTPPSPGFRTGFIDEDMIRTYGGDLAHTLFYVSGPHGMVTALKHTLQSSGVPLAHIRTDFFSGYA